MLAIRAVREHMYIGIRESQVRALLSTALFAAGITESWMLVLFGGKCVHPSYISLIDALLQKTPLSHTVVALIGPLRSQISHLLTQAASCTDIAATSHV